MEEERDEEQIARLFENLILRARVWGRESGNVRDGLNEMDDERGEVFIITLFSKLIIKYIIKIIIILEGKKLV